LERLVESFKKASHLKPSKEQCEPLKLFLSYIAPPSPFGTASARQAGQISGYIERVQLINQDVEWLLKLNVDAFKHQIETNQTISKLLRTYLNAYSTVYLFKHEYDYGNDDDDDRNIHRVNSILKRFMFYLILRMFTITPNHVTRMMTTCDLFDLAVLYDENKCLDNMIDTFATKSSKFNEEFRSCVKTELFGKFRSYEDALDKLTANQSLFCFSLLLP
jgi:hypothetical protein